MMHSARVAGEGDVNGGVYMLKPYISTLATAVIRTMGMNTLFGADGSYVGKSFTISDYYQVTTFVSAFFLVFLIFLIIRRRQERKAVRGIAGTAFVICLLITVPAFSYIENAFSTVNYRWLFSFSLVGASVVALALNEIVNNGMPRVRGMVFSVIASVVILTGFIGILAIKNGNTLDCIKDICKGSGSAYSAIVIMWVLLIVFTACLGDILKDSSYSRNTYVALLTLIMCVDIVMNCSYIW